MQDQTKDLQDLRGLMRDAMASGSDAEMLDVLGVRRDEMPEAIKTLQRELERWNEESDEQQGEDEPAVTKTRGGLVKMVRRLSLQSKGGGDGDGEGGETLKRSKTVTSKTSSSSSGGGSGLKRKSVGGSGSGDTLDREFIEGGIDALRRMSRGLQGHQMDLNLPSWTITRLVFRCSLLFKFER